MKLFFSGQSNNESLPESALANTNNGKGPCIMLTYHEIYHGGGSVSRFNRLMERRDEPEKKAKQRVWLHFLDSGAHSLYMKHVQGRVDRALPPAEREAEAYRYYRSEAFWQRVDAYAEFVKDHRLGCDYYANLDVIFNPSLTRQVQKYLEDQHGLEPVPVVHCGTPVSVLEGYLAEGRQIIALGGLGQDASEETYKRWAHSMFNVLCPPPKRRPIVKVHGFAMTGYDLVKRYPWWSVDSSSWAKSASYGMIYVPRTVAGEFVFTKRPYSVACSVDSAGVNTAKHFIRLTQLRKDVIEKWLEKLELPLGKADKWGDMMEWGVTTHHAARKIANLRFYKMFEEWKSDQPYVYGPGRQFALLPIGEMK